MLARGAQVVPPGIILPEPRLRLYEAQLQMSDRVMVMGVPLEEAGEMIARASNGETSSFPFIPT